MRPAQPARRADLPGGGSARALDALLVDAQHEHLLHAACALGLGQLALVVGGEHGHELVGLVHALRHQRGDLAVLPVDRRQRAVAALAVHDAVDVAVRHDHGGFSGSPPVASMLWARAPMSPKSSRGFCWLGRMSPRRTDLFSNCISNLLVVHPARRGPLDGAGDGDQADERHGAHDAAHALGK